MEKIVLLSFISVIAATPISFHRQEDGQYFVPIYHQHIKRSDQEQHYGNSLIRHNDNEYDGAQSGYEYSSSHIDSASGSDTGHQDSSYSHFDAGRSFDGGHGGFDSGNSYVQSVPVSEHVEVTKPVPVPVYKDIGIPVPHEVKINIPYPITVGVPQPYPVAVPVLKPVPIQIIKTVAIPVEKKVPYPVEKHIPVPVEKPVPITIEKHIPVPVIKPYPIKIPIYKTVYHHAKSHY